MPDSRPDPLARPRLSAPGLLGITAAALLILILCRVVSAAPRANDRIVAAGQRFSIGTPVVLWTDQDGYDAYQRKKHFTVEEQPDGRRRYGQRRTGLPQAIAERIARSGWQLETLRKVVHQVVLHYDAAGSSRQCFKVLHDNRFLSVHLLLDTDGTIYQTLDLQEHAHHATIANACSIGVEIAHPGCWLRERHPDMLRWYRKEADGAWFLRSPKWLQQSGPRTPGFLPRPDRPDVLSGSIHGTRYYQLDYTPEQYRALAHLCAALHRVFPRIKLDVPRAADGSVMTTQLPRHELLEFEGIVGHFHVQRNKVDPGPALQWERLLTDARALSATNR